MLFGWYIFRYQSRRYKDYARLYPFMLWSIVYSGTEEISEGLSNTDYLMHNRSVLENVIYNNAGEPFNGSIEIVNGKLTTNDITVVGDSLLLGADLTKAFAEVCSVNLVNT